MSSAATAPVAAATRAAATPSACALSIACAPVNKVSFGQARMTTPTNAPPDLSRWAPSIKGYAEWIAADDLTEAREWEHRINQKTAAHVEGAIAEAVAWAYLFPRVDSIRRFPPSASGGNGAWRSPSPHRPIT